MHPLVRLVEVISQPVERGYLLRMQVPQMLLVFVEL